MKYLSLVLKTLKRLITNKVSVFLCKFSTIEKELVLTFYFTVILCTTYRRQTHSCYNLNRTCSGTSEGFSEALCIGGGAVLPNFICIDTSHTWPNRLSVDIIAVAWRRS